MDEYSVDSYEGLPRERHHAVSLAAASRDPVTLEANLGELRLVAGGIAHDFNNALTVILGNAAMLERELPGGSPARARVARIAGSARQASAMAEGLVAVASSEQAKCVPLDLAAWLDSAGPAMRQAAGPHVSLQIESTPGLPRVSGDRAQLERLVASLLANTRDALGEGIGRVWVRTGLGALEAGDEQRFFPSGNAPRGLCVYIEVEDDGPGLSCDAQVRLFEPFFTTRPGALGLGLAAVLRIVNQHRGAIEVENEPGHAGRGVRFRVWLPAVVRD